MVAVPNPTQLVRLSPSGPELGTPPQQIGGGALIPGREWYAQGTGADLVQTPNPAADVPNLSSVAVDMRVGYKYDLEVDAQFFGTTGQPEITLIGLVGVTPTTIKSSTPFSPSGHTGSCRLHLTYTPGTAFDHLEVKVANAAGAEATCQYLPQLTALRVREYSTS